MKYEFYLAGPFFNSEQIETIATIERIFEEECISFYSPRRSGIVFKDLTPLERELAAAQVFKANIDNIDDSQYIIACIDDRDTGTAWEIGYHFGKRGKESRIITFSGKGYGANVMLSQCTVGHFGHIKETLEFISSYADYRDLDKVLLRQGQKAAETDE